MTSGPLKTILILTGAAGLLVALVLAFSLRKEDTTNATPPENGNKADQIEPNAAGALPVQVINPERRDIAFTITLPANISPWYQATLYAKVPGYLKWMGADKGDAAKKGQLLAVIDAPEVEQQYQQAESDYKINK